MTVEEVEPGVYRVIDDGVREIALDISTRDVGYTIIEAIAGHDGSVWLAGEGTAFRLGDEATYGRRED